jgi:hypothetical protein
MSKTNIEDVKRYFSMMELKNTDNSEFFKEFFRIIPFDANEVSVDNLDEEILEKANTLFDTRLIITKGRTVAEDMRFIFTYDWTTQKLIMLCLNLFREKKIKPFKNIPLPPVHKISKRRVFNSEELKFFNSTINNNIIGSDVYKGYLATFGFERTFYSVMDKFYKMRKIQRSKK